jgi:Zn-dependent protease with chaperone function
VTEQLRSLVPAWVEWLGPVTFIVATALVLLLLPTSEVRACLRRQNPADHWTEQARHTYSARGAIVLAAVVAPAAVWFLSTMTIGPLVAVPAWPFGVLGVTGALLWIVRTGWRFERSLGRPVPPPGRFAAWFGVRLAPVTAIFILTLTAPEDVFSPWLPVWLVLALGIAFSMRFQLEVLEVFGLADPAEPAVVSLVERAADRMGVRRPAVYVIQHHQPNAFAFPWREKVAFTSRAISVLSEEELEAVATHELGHLSEPTAAVYVRQALQFICVPLVFIKPVLFTYRVLGGVIVVAVVAALVLAVRRFVASQESHSDDRAVTHNESGAYGRALEKVYRIGLIPAVLRRPTHGQLHERLAKAGLEVGFDPPLPPSSRRLLMSAVGVVGVGFAVLLAPYLTSMGADARATTPAHVALAFGTYGSWPYERLAELAEFDGDFATAEAFYAAGVDRDADPDLMIDLVYVRSQLGRCSEAAAVIEDLSAAGAASSDVEIANDFLDWCRAVSGAGL